MIVHFRIINELYILNEVFDVLQKNGYGPQANVLPDKQTFVHLVLWYFAYITLMREVAHPFCQYILSMSTVQGVPKDVLKLLVNKAKRM